MFNLFNPSGSSNAAAYYGAEEADIAPNACPLAASLFAAVQAERRI
jgi:hypothetical protein